VMNRIHTRKTDCIWSPRKEEADMKVITDPAERRRVLANFVALFDERNNPGRLSGAHLRFASHLRCGRCQRATIRYRPPVGILRSPLRSGPQRIQAATRHGRLAATCRLTWTAESGLKEARRPKPASIGGSDREPSDAPSQRLVTTGLAHLYRCILIAEQRIERSRDLVVPKDVQCACFPSQGFSKQH
jgi:hypothetical protein